MLRTPKDRVNAVETEIDVGVVALARGVEDGLGGMRGETAII
jgi:hypothetical protein